MNSLSHFFAWVMCSIFVWNFQFQDIKTQVECRPTSSQEDGDANDRISINLSCSLMTECVIVSVVMPHCVNGLISEPDNIGSRKNLALVLSSKPSKSSYGASQCKPGSLSVQGLLLTPASREPLRLPVCRFVPECSIPLLGTRSWSDSNSSMLAVILVSNNKSYIGAILLCFRGYAQVVASGSVTSWERSKNAFLSNSKFTQQPLTRESRCPRLSGNEINQRIKHLGPSFLFKGKEIGSSKSGVHSARGSLNSSHTMTKSNVHSARKILNSSHTMTKSDVHSARESLNSSHTMKKSGVHSARKSLNSSHIMTKSDVLSAREILNSSHIITKSGMQFEREILNSSHTMTTSGHNNIFESARRPNKSKHRFYREVVNEAEDLAVLMQGENAKNKQKMTEMIASDFSKPEKLDEPVSRVRTPFRGLFKRFRLLNRKIINQHTAQRDKKLKDSRRLPILLPKWGRWSAWSECTSPCKKGAFQMRKRTCKSLPGLRCDGESLNMKPCNQSLECKATWKEWGDWGPCSVTCGDGFQARSRTCLTMDIGVRCKGWSSTIKSCRYPPCQDEGKFPSEAEDADTSEDSHKEEAGKRDQRVAMNSFQPAAAPAPPLVVDKKSELANAVVTQGHQGSHKSQRYGWSIWGTWSSCSKVCGKGQKSRIRACLDTQRTPAVQAFTRHCGGGISSQLKTCKRNCSASALAAGAASASGLVVIDDNDGENPKQSGGETPTEEEEEESQLSPETIIFIVLILLALILFLMSFCIWVVQRNKTAKIKSEISSIHPFYRSDTGDEGPAPGGGVIKPIYQHDNPVTHQLSPLPVDDQQQHVIPKRPSRESDDSSATAEMMREAQVLLRQLLAQYADQKSTKGKNPRMSQSQNEAPGADAPSSRRPSPSQGGNVETVLQTQRESAGKTRPLSSPRGSEEYKDLLKGSKHQRKLKRLSRHVYRRPRRVTFLLTAKTKPRKTEDTSKSHELSYELNPSEQNIMKEPDMTDQEITFSTSGGENEFKKSPAFFSSPQTHYSDCHEDTGVVEPEAEIILNQCQPDSYKTDRKRYDEDEDDGKTKSSVYQSCLAKTSLSCANLTERSNDIQMRFLSCVDSQTNYTFKSLDKDEDDSYYEKKKKEILQLMENAAHKQDTSRSLEVKGIENGKRTTIGVDAYKQDTIQKYHLPYDAGIDISSAKDSTSNTVPPCQLRSLEQRSPASSLLSIKTQSLAGKDESLRHSLVKEGKETTWSESITGKRGSCPSPFADIWKSELERATGKNDSQTVASVAMNSNLPTSTLEYVSLSSRCRQSQQQEQNIRGEQPSNVVDVGLGEITKKFAHDDNQSTPTDVKASLADVTLDDEATSEDLDQVLVSQLDNFVMSTASSIQESGKGDSSKSEEIPIAAKGRKRHQRSYVRRVREMAGAKVILSGEPFTVKAKSWIMNDCPAFYGKTSQADASLRVETLKRKSPLGLHEIEKCESLPLNITSSPNLINKEEKSHISHPSPYQDVYPRGSDSLEESRENYVSVEEVSESSPACHTAASYLDLSGSASWCSVPASYVTPISDSFEVWHWPPTFGDSWQSSQVKQDVNADVSFSQVAKREQEQVPSSDAKDSIFYLLPTQSREEIREEREEMNENVKIGTSPSRHSPDQAPRDFLTFRTPGNIDRTTVPNNQQDLPSENKRETKGNEYYYSDLSELSVENQSVMQEGMTHAQEIDHFSQHKSLTSSRLYSYTIQSPLHPQKRTRKTSGAPLQSVSMETACWKDDPISWKSLESRSSITVHSLPEMFSGHQDESLQICQPVDHQPDLSGDVMGLWNFSQTDSNVSHMPWKRHFPETDVSLSVFSVGSVETIGDVMSSYHGDSSLRKCVSVATRTCSSQSHHRFHSVDDIACDFPGDKRRFHSEMFNSLHEGFGSSGSETSNAIESAPTYSDLSHRESRAEDQEFSPLHGSPMVDSHVRGQTQWPWTRSPQPGLVVRSQSAPDCCQRVPADDGMSPTSNSCSSSDKIHQLSDFSNGESLTTGSISLNVSSSVDESKESTSSDGRFSDHERHDDNTEVKRKCLF